MATTIKIHVADGRDRDAKVNLSPEQAAACRHFLAHVTYGDIYRHMPHTGDGNTKGSPSDQETCSARDGLNLLGHVFDSALSDQDSAKAKAYCDCWMCLNTGPNGECEKCGLPPSPDRVNRTGKFAQ